MTINEMLTHVDHTQLNAYAAWEDIVKLCDEAVLYHTASVCIPPAYVKRVKEAYGDRLVICTVVGFPLGYSTREAKEEEVRQALADGCDEVDMVINISDVKNGLYEKVREEIASLKQICRDRILKVIVEACYLTEDEKIAMCRVVTAAGADYIKTSTGFGTGGATKEDVALFKKHIGFGVKIKAAGGIRTLEELAVYLRLGCDRVGMSKTAEACEGRNGDEYGK